MEKIRILALDIDGPLVTLRSHFARPDWNKTGFMDNPDRIMSNFIINLIKISRVPLKIVVSSTWRFHEAKCKALLESVGLIPYLHEDWRTTIYESCDKSLKGGIINRRSIVPEDEARGGEINEWLKRHPEVVDYRIIDDSKDMLKSQMNKFIKCDTNDGLSSAKMKKLIDWAIS